jgi:hypothetical protein
MGPLGAVLVQQCSDAALGSVHGPRAGVLSMSKQDCKVFVGGLSWETSDEKLRYGLRFERMCAACGGAGPPPGAPMGAEGLPRASCTPGVSLRARIVANIRHICVPFRAFFENFGTVLEAFVSYDRHTGRPRGFGFVVFEDPAVADKVVSLQHTIDRREVRKPYHSTGSSAAGSRCYGFDPHLGFL